MNAQVLFQYPKKAIPTNAQVVVTPGKIRCDERVFDMANVDTVEVRSGGLRWGRFIAIAALLLIAGIGFPSIIGTVLLLAAAVLAYRTLTKRRWAYWNCFIFMRETEDVIMSGDSGNRVAGLFGVDRGTANQCAEAVKQATAVCSA